MNVKRKRAWIASQEWHCVLFMHWPIPVQIIRKYVPPPFKIDTINGNAWLSIVLFKGANSRPRGIPSSFSGRSFLQVNVRTYVLLNDEPAIYFLSIDTNSPLFVFGATTLLSLPYYKAYLSYSYNEQKYHFVTHHNEKEQPYLDVSFSPKKEQINSELAKWLTERYCMYTIKGKKIIKIPISHHPWNLYDVHIKMKNNESILTHINPFIKELPLAHFAPYMKAYLHPIERVGLYKKE